MNESLQAILLGIVQGLTEFLPVSSSGHIELGKVILGYKPKGEESMLMTVVLHFATAVSTVVVFWRDIVEIFKGLGVFLRKAWASLWVAIKGKNLGEFKLEWNDETKFCAMIIVSMIPAAFVGLVFEKQIETLFDQNILLVGLMLLVTGILLIFADRAKNTDKAVSFPSAFLIGIAQAIAILPGISRSGATISTSVLLGIDRRRAARFSFLMVVPLIFAKMFVDVVGGDFSNSQGTGLLALCLGFIAAFFTGLLACKWMIALVRACKLWTFSIYCFVVGLGSIIYAIVT